EKPQDEGSQTSKPDRHPTEQARDHQAQTALEPGTLARNDRGIPDRGGLQPRHGQDTRIHEADRDHRSVRQHHIRRSQRTTLQVRPRNNQDSESTDRDLSTSTWSRCRNRPKTLENNRGKKPPGIPPKPLPKNRRDDRKNIPPLRRPRSQAH